MKTSDTVQAIKQVNKKITLAEGLALSEKMRLENLTVEDLLNQWSPKMLQAVASNHIDLNHINFVTQAPIHCNDCLICGALQAGV